jgi:hypothetical protein
MPHGGILTKKRDAPSGPYGLGENVPKRRKTDATGCPTLGQGGP